MFIPFVKSGNFNKYGVKLSKSKIPFLCTHSLWKALTFCISSILSLLLQEKGNKARNRRIQTKTWLFFCSQLLSGNISTVFPNALLCCYSGPLLPAQLHGGLAVSKAAAGARSAHSRFINYHPHPRHALQSVCEKVRRIQTRRSSSTQKGWEDVPTCMIWQVKAQGETFSRDSGSQETQVLKYTACPSNIKTFALQLKCNGWMMEVGLRKNLGSDCGRS